MHSRVCPAAVQPCREWEGTPTHCTPTDPEQGQIFDTEGRNFALNACDQRPAAERKKVQAVPVLYFIES